MKEKNLKVPDYRIINLRFSIINAINTLLLYTAVLVCTWIIYLVYTDFTKPHERIYLLVPLIHFGFHFFSIIFCYRTEFRKLSDLKSETIGKYKSSEIKKLFDNMILENFKDGDEKPEIYVDKLDNDAFTMNALHINFIKRMNFILISESLIEKLTEGELKAVIGHEIAHFKKYIPVGTRVYFVYYLLKVLLSYVITISLNPYSFSIKTYFFIYILINLTAFLWNYFFNRFRHDIEFLSDKWSAKRYGKLNMINALIKLYHDNLKKMIITLEIFNFIKRSNNLDVEDFLEVYDKLKNDASLNILSDEDLLKDVKLKLDRISFEDKNPFSGLKLFKRNAHLKSLIKKIKNEMNYKHLRWDSIDLNKNGAIDLSEYKGLISKIKRNPDIQLFQLPGDNIRKMKNKSHPTLRERILFLDKNIKRETFGFVKVQGLKTDI